MTLTHVREGQAATALLGSSVCFFHQTGLAACCVVLVDNAFGSSLVERAQRVHDGLLVSLAGGNGGFCLLDHRLEAGVVGGVALVPCL